MSDPRVRLAMFLLEELALRGGCSKLRFLKTWRMMVFWLGPDYARHIVQRLVEGKYIEYRMGKICLAREFPCRRSLTALLREAEEFMKQLFATLFKSR